MTSAARKAARRFYRAMAHYFAGPPTDERAERLNALKVNFEREALKLNSASEITKLVKYGREVFASEAKKLVGENQQG